MLWLAQAPTVTEAWISENIQILANFAEALETDNIYIYKPEEGRSQRPEE